MDEARALLAEALNALPVEFEELRARIARFLDETEGDR